ncbi:MAG: DUF1292 domain-containing protein [Christensenellales bacterium]|jgi:uncharacterized protein YrzB (UPF0473 family)
MTEDFNSSEAYFDFFDDDSDIIELTDEGGKTEQFHYIATVPYEDEEYILLTSASDEDNDDYAEVVVLKIEQDENGEDMYISCENDETSQAVFDLFLQMLEDEEY